MTLNETVKDYIESRLGAFAGEHDLRFNRVTYPARNSVKVFFVKLRPKYTAKEYLIELEGMSWTNLADGIEGIKKDVIKVFGLDVEKPAPKKGSYLEQMCGGCKHWTGSVWAEHCRACCFNSKFEAKDYVDTDVASMYPKSVYITTAGGRGGVHDMVKQLMNKQYDGGGFTYKPFTLDLDSTPHEMEVARNYYLNDVRMMEELYMYNRIPRIEKVIFNHPATIVFWSDNTKTIVKASDDELFDAEKGLAMAIAKKALGNQGNYYETFKKYIPELDRKEEKKTVVVEGIDGSHRFELNMEDDLK